MVTTIQTQSQKWEAARGIDSINPTSAPSQDHAELMALVQYTYTMTLHLQMYMSLQDTNLRLVGRMLLVERYLLAFAHKGERKVVNQQPLTHQQVFVKTSSVGGSTMAVSNIRISRKSFFLLIQFFFWLQVNYKQLTTVTHLYCHKC